MIRDILIFIGMMLEGTVFVVAWVFTLILSLVFAIPILIVAFLTRKHPENLKHGRLQ